MRFSIALFLGSTTATAFVIPRGIEQSSSPTTTAVFAEADLTKKLKISGVDKDWTSSPTSNTWTREAYKDGPGWSQISNLNFLETSVESQRREKEFEKDVKKAEKEYERVKKNLEDMNSKIKDVKFKAEDAQKKLETVFSEKQQIEDRRNGLTIDMKNAERRIHEKKDALKQYRATVKKSLTTEGGLATVGVAAAFLTIAAARNGGRDEVVRERQEMRRLQAAPGRMEPAFNQGFNSNQNNFNNQNFNSNLGFNNGFNSNEGFNGNQSFNSNGFNSGVNNRNNRNDRSNNSFNSRSNTRNTNFNNRNERRSAYDESFESGLQMTPSLRASLPGGSDDYLRSRPYGSSTRQDRNKAYQSNNRFGSSARQNDRNGYRYNNNQQSRPFGSPTRSSDRNDYRYNSNQQSRPFGSSSRQDYNRNQINGELDVMRINGNYINGAGASTAMMDRPTSRINGAGASTAMMNSPKKKNSWSLFGPPAGGRNNNRRQEQARLPTIRGMQQDYRYQQEPRYQQNNNRFQQNDRRMNTRTTQSNNNRFRQNTRMQANSFDSFEFQEGDKVSTKFGPGVVLDFRPNQGLYVVELENGRQTAYLGPEAVDRLYEDPYDGPGY